MKNQKHIQGFVDPKQRMMQFKLLKLNKLETQLVSLQSKNKQVFNQSRRIIKLRNVTMHPTKEFNKRVESSRYGSIKNSVCDRSQLMTESQLFRPNRHRHNHSLVSEMAISHDAQTLAKKSAASPYNLDARF